VPPQRSDSVLGGFFIRIAAHRITKLIYDETRLLIMNYTYEKAQKPCSSKVYKTILKNFEKILAMV